jgi:hypothetical protein
VKKDGQLAREREREREIEGGEGRENTCGEGRNETYLL